MGFPSWPSTKSPEDVLDYSIDWSSWLGEDTLTSAQWSSDDGVTLESSSITDTSSVVWISGGESDTVYAIKCVIETSLGRKCARTINIKVKSK